MALPSTLSAAPRAVPASFVVAEALPFRPSYLWILFFVGAAPIALWIARPLLFGVVGFGHRRGDLRVAVARDQDAT